jgi:hypothetical protein|tara:strand:+ start:1812 stop:2555 length:744 start_codon:yes stop_codon:yes gene_type:complete
MGLGEQGVTVVPESPRRWLPGKKWVFITFSMIVALLLFFGFYENPITGNIIGSGEPNMNKNETFNIKANLNEIDSIIKINGKISEISIEAIGEENRLIIEKKSNIDLPKTGVTKINILNFSGEISFDKGNITKLKGNAITLSINNLPTSSTDGKIGIVINQGITYRSIELKEFFLKEYESIINGEISFGDEKLSLKLENESLKIENFFGDLNAGLITNKGIQKTGFVLNGIAENVETEGSFQLNLQK